ncbi:MAG: tetratricopeptide repeat protein [Spirochaetes bacterium]|nr:tetratricopeptide repeat protein [Spirochaetota bacterium]
MSKPTVIITACVLLAFSLSAFPQSGGDPDPTFKKAMKYFFERKFEMAQILLQESIKKNPENTLAYSYLGDIFLYKKRYDAANSMYKKALDLNPASAENYFRIGQIYYYKKDGLEAIDNFSKAFELDSSLKAAQFHIGLSYLMLQRDKEKTIEHWERFIAIAPEDPQYENIRRVIELLRDPNFTIPPVGSEVSIEEALHLGGITMKQLDRTTTDKLADHEKMKVNKKIKDVYIDDEM